MSRALVWSLLLLSWPVFATHRAWQQELVPAPVKGARVYAIPQARSFLGRTHTDPFPPAAPPIGTGSAGTATLSIGAPPAAPPTTGLTTTATIGRPPSTTSTAAAPILPATGTAPVLPTTAAGPALPTTAAGPALPTTGAAPVVTPVVTGVSTATAPFLPGSGPTTPATTMQTPAAPTLPTTAAPAVTTITTPATATPQPTATLPHTPTTNTGGPTGAAPAVSTPTTPAGGTGGPTSPGAPDTGSPQATGGAGDGAGGAGGSSGAPAGSGGEANGLPPAPGAQQTTTAAGGVGDLTARLANAVFDLVTFAPVPAPTPNPSWNPDADDARLDVLEAAVMKLERAVQDHKQRAVQQLNALGLDASGQPLPGSPSTPLVVTPSAGTVPAVPIGTGGGGTGGAGVGVGPVGGASAGSGDESGVAQLVASVGQPGLGGGVVNLVPVLTTAPPTAPPATMLPAPSGLTTEERSAQMKAAIASANPQQMDVAHALAAGDIGNLAQEAVAEAVEASQTSPSGQSQREVQIEAAKLAKTTAQAALAAYQHALATGVVPCTGPNDGCPLHPTAAPTPPPTPQLTCVVPTSQPTLTPTLAPTLEPTNATQAPTPNATQKLATPSPTHPTLTPTAEPTYENITLSPTTPSPTMAPTSAPTAPTTAEEPLSTSEPPKERIEVIYVTLAPTAPTHAPTLTTQLPTPAPSLQPAATEGNQKCTKCVFEPEYVGDEKPEPADTEPEDEASGSSWSDDLLNIRGLDSRMSTRDSDLVRSRLAAKMASRVHDRFQDDYENCKTKLCLAEANEPLLANAPPVP